VGCTGGQTRREKPAQPLVYVIAIARGLPPYVGTVLL